VFYRSFAEEDRFVLKRAEIGQKELLIILAIREIGFARAFLLRETLFMVVSPGITVTTGTLDGL
jgi:hypothetical protein